MWLYTHSLHTVFYTEIILNQTEKNDRRDFDRNVEGDMTHPTSMLSACPEAFLDYTRRKPFNLNIIHIQNSL